MTSNSDILLKMLRRDPDNDILAAMLLDARAEDTNTPPETSVAWVENVRECFRNERMLSIAAALIRHGAPHRDELHRRIRRICHLNPTTGLSLLLRTDHDGPVATHRPGNDAGRYWPNWTVTVGAGWVIEQCYAMDQSASSERRRARRRAERR